MFSLVFGNYGFFDILFNVLPCVIKTFTDAKEVIDDYNKERDEIFDEVTSSDESKVSCRLAGDITIMANGVYELEKKYMAKAVYTNKWIQYAYYYMTTDNAVKIKADREEKRLVNAIGEVAGFGKIYLEEESSSLKIYDARRLNSHYDGRFLLSIFDIMDVIDDLRFQKAWKDRKFKMEMNNTPVLQVNPAVQQAMDYVAATGLNATVDNNGMIHPIFFRSNDEEYDLPPIKPDDMPDSLYLNYDRNFQSLCGDNKYYYSHDDYGNWYINISRPQAMGAIDSYMLDNGSIMATNDTWIMGNYYNYQGAIDTVFVNVNKHPDIASRIINNAFYMMDPQEVHTAMLDQFNNGIIYRHIDFSEIDTSNLDFDQKIQLEKNLSYAINLLESDIRLRFDTFVSPTQFKLVSDSETKSPLAFKNITAPQIQEGFSITFNNNVVVKHSGGIDTQYQLQ